jgi:hypothetical protein
MPPASSLRHTASQYGTGAFRYHAWYRNACRLGVASFRYPTGSAIGFLFHSGVRLTGWRTVRHLQKVYKGGKEYTLTSTMSTEERDTPTRHTLHVHTKCDGKTPWPCTSILLVVERHPAHPYCWLCKAPCTSKIAGGEQKIKVVRHRIFTGSQLHQSVISIPVSGSVW